MLRGGNSEADFTAVQLHRMFRSGISVYPDGKSWPHDAETIHVLLSIAGSLYMRIQGYRPIRFTNYRLEKLGVEVPYFVSVRRGT